MKLLSYILSLIIPDLKPEQAKPLIMLGILYALYLYNTLKKMIHLQHHGNDCCMEN
jgi:hypothetical protein